VGWGVRVCECVWVGGGVWFWFWFFVVVGFWLQKSHQHSTRRMRTLEPSLVITKPKAHATCTAHPDSTHLEFGVSEGP